jgi:hypothetical protein
MPQFDIAFHQFVQFGSHAPHLGTVTVEHIENLVLGPVERPGGA